MRVKTICSPLWLFAMSVPIPHSVFRAAASGKPLPTPRYISRAVHPDEGFHDHAVTLLLVAWGQFLDHDITLSAETRDTRTGKTPKCCDGSGPGPAHPNCLPIEIPADDDFFRQHGQRCMNFVRTLAGVSYDCKLGPRRTFNEISSFNVIKGFLNLIATHYTRLIARM